MNMNENDDREKNGRNSDGGKTNRKALLSLYTSGAIDREYLVSKGVDTNSFSFLYADFRKNGLSVLDSFYNAAYISSYHKLDNSAKKLKKEYENVFSHPAGWYQKENDVFKKGLWDHVIAFFAAIPKFLRKIGDRIEDLGKKAVKRRKNFLARSDSSVKSASSVIRFLLRHKKVVAICAILVLSTVSVTVTLSKSPLVNVFVDGEFVGQTENVDNVTGAKLDMENDMTSALRRDYCFNNDITYSISEAKKGALLSRGDIYNILYQKASDEVVTAYGLFIDGTLVAANDNKSLLSDAMNEILESYKTYENNNSGKVVRVDYANDVRISERTFLRRELSDINDIRRILGLPPIKTDGFRSMYLVAYESLGLDQRNDGNLKSEVDEFHPTLRAMSPAVANDGIIEDVSVMQQNEAGGGATLNYKIVKIEKFTETAEKGIDYIDDDTLFVGVKFPVKSGSDGKVLSTYEISYVDGQEVERRLIDSEIVKKPTNALIRRGTKIPTDAEKELVPTGTYIYPYQGGYVSSGFGQRNFGGATELHLAWDIPGPVDSPVVAIDGGVVEEVSRSSGYGNYIIIAHGDGLESVYAHLNSTCVNVGDRVGQGFLIGKIGRTGRASGYHVHLEIRLNGVPQNPGNYLTKITR